MNDVSVSRLNTVMILWSNESMTMSFNQNIIYLLMSGSCHLDRALDVEIGVECQIFVIVKLRQSFTIWGTFKVL